ncbi:MAG: DinB family protein [Gemmatimonadota bacterium]
MPTNHDTLIQRYADGPALIRQALAKLPAEVLQWRPGPDKWSVHEVIVHCADSETNAHMRLRYLLAEPDPLIVGYDQAGWATALDYHSRPLDPAMATVEAVRANTVPLLRSLSDSDWKKTGRHTEYPGPFGVEKWMELYADHLEVHTRQIERNVDAYGKTRGSG